MESNELSQKIVENVKNMVVMSNLEKEEMIKMSRRKQIFSIIAVVAVMLTGGFATVNAVTNGEFVNKVIDTVQVIFVKDGVEKEIEGYTYTNSDNRTMVKYELNDAGVDYSFEIDKTALDDGIKIKNVIDDEVNIMIMDK